MELKVLKLHKDAKLPYKQYDGDACFDLYAIEDTEVMPYGVTKIRFGIAWEMPRGYEGVVRSRSSSFVNKNLHVYVGTVDQQYRGEIICVVSMILPNLSPRLWIKKGEAVAQVAFRKVPIFNVREVSKLSKTDRGDKGFGSTDDIERIDAHRCDDDCKVS